MRTVWSLGLAVLAFTAILLFTDYLFLKRLIVELDERPAASQSARRVLARIQADLERGAVGRSSWPLPVGSKRDPLERLVDAQDAFLKGRQRLFADHVAAVRAEAVQRLAHQDEVIRGQRNKVDLDKVVSPLSYAEALAEPPHAPPLLALVLAMRLADAVLILEDAEASPRQMRYDLKARRNIWPQTTLSDGVWLRLPCPVVRGRSRAFEAVAARLDELAGPLLSCPLPDFMERDFARMDVLAKHPADFAVHAVPGAAAVSAWDQRPPSPPWDDVAAIRFMDINPDGAEPPLRLASMSRGAGKVDLALFLHAFRDQNPSRDEDIRSLMAAIDRVALSKASPVMLRFSGDPVPYDGSDASLIPSLRLASFTGTAEIVSGAYRYPYAIPCAVLTRHPALAAAGVYASQPTEDDGTVELRPAVSGCLVGRGRVEGFPEADFAAFLLATAAADGGGSFSRGKMPRYPLPYSDMDKMKAILFEPRSVLDWPQPVMAVPYQTWAYASLGNHAIAGQLRVLFDRAKTSLAIYFRSKGLGDGEAILAAERALFSTAHGANCGNGPPPQSLRRALIEGGSLEAVAAALNDTSAEALKPFAECARTAPFDPLLHVAVGHSALPLLWAAAGSLSPEADREGVRQIRDVNLRNHFGKTPLMVAAQADQPEAARFLLEKGARVNADTWQSVKPRSLAHDSRTALMYAASNGSAEMIRLLLDAGADRFQADSKGRRALDYLLGYGPLPVNSVLSLAERSEMARLLY